MSIEQPLYTDILTYLQKELKSRRDRRKQISQPIIITNSWIFTHPICESSKLHQPFWKGNCSYPIKFCSLSHEK